MMDHSAGNCIFDWKKYTEPASGMSQAMHTGVYPQMHEATWLVAFARTWSLEKKSRIWYDY